MSDTTGRRRGRPPAAESPVSTEDILLAALQAFAERGYDGMSVREVSQRLGVSHNLLFQRFGRKEELWRAVVDHYLGAVRDELAAIAVEAEARSADRLEVFRELVVGFIVANAARPELLRMMSLEASVDSERLTYLYEHYVRKSTGAMGRVYRSLVQDGVLRRLPPATFFFLLAHGATAPAGHVALARRLGQPNPSDPRVARRHAEAVADLMIDGLRVR